MLFWVGVVVAAAVVAVAAELWAHRRYAGEPPVVWSFVPVLHSALEFGKRPVELLLECVQRHDKAFVLLLGPRRMVFCVDHTVYPSVFKNAKLLDFREISQFFSEQVFRCDYKHSHEDHKVASQQLVRFLIQADGLGKVTRATQEVLRPVMEGLAGEGGGGGGGGQHDLLALVTGSMFVATTHALFGPRIATQELWKDFRLFDKGFPLLAAGLPDVVVRSACAARSRLHSHLLRAMPTALSKDMPRNELFPGACEVVCERVAHMVLEKGCSREQTAARDIGILWASLGNVLPATFWLVFFLARDPAALASVRKEVDRAVGELAKLKDAGGGGDDGAALQAVLDGMVLLDSAVTETLRMTNLAMIVRKVTAATTLPLGPNGAPIALRKDDQVCLFPQLPMRDEALFPNPREFVVDRFVAKRADGKNSPALVQLAFGGGVSLCPGRKYARNEMKMFVLELLRCWEVSLADPQCPEPRVDFARTGLGIAVPLESSPVFVRLAKRKH